MTDRAGTPWLAVTALLLNATIWGFAWWPIRSLAAAGLHTLWATALIFAIGTAGVLLLLRPSLGPGGLGDRRLWWFVLGSGVANGSFNWALTLADVARVALLFYLMPVWAALLARWLLGERLTGTVVGRIALALTGAAIVLVEPGREAARTSFGADLLAVLSGAAFAANTVLLRRFTGLTRGAISLAMFGGSAVMPALVALLLTAAGSAPPLPAAAGPWLLVALATAAAFLLGNLSLQYGAARLPANTTALIMLAELAVAALSAAWLAGEVLTGRVLLGGALIVAAVVWSLQRPRHPPAGRPG
ncbi:MAG: DMT family transporter [Lautropia sp.]